MTDKNIKNKLKRAIENAAPDDFESVISDCGEERGIVMTDNVKVKKKRTWPKIVVAACLALALIGGVGGFIWQKDIAVASVVSIDVNPSIELTVSKSERVLSCTGMNEDAKTVLAEMNGGEDLKGAKLDVAVNALVGALLRHGYFEGMSSAILVSVEDKDEARSARIQQDLVAWIDEVLKAESVETAVFSQNTTPSKNTAASHDSSMSTGKEALINRIITEKGLGEDAFAKLSALTVKELWEFQKSSETRIPIGTDAAVEAAKQYAGITGDVIAEADPEFDKDPAHYEVEIRTGGVEYEYVVDAFDGKVLGGAPNVDGTTQAPAAQITESDAKTAAETHMKGMYPELADGKIEYTKVKLDGGKYEIEFFVGGYEFEYDVDIYTGVVVDWETNYRKQHTENTPSAPSDGTTANDIGADGAKSAAFAHAGVTEAETARVKVERDYENGRLEYEVEFYVGTTEYEYTIDGATGSVLSFEADTHKTSSSSGTGSAPEINDIGEARARAAALSHANVEETDVTGLRIKREYDDGRLEYEIEFYVGTTEYEYTIDGATGKVLEHKTEKHNSSSTNTGNTGNTGSTGTGNNTSANDIGEAAAKSAAFSNAGVSEANVKNLVVKREYDNGRLEYEIEFYVGTTEYEYTVDGATGAILEHKTEEHNSSTGSSGNTGSTGTGSNTSANDVGEAAAKSAAFAHAGVSDADVKGLIVKREYDDGRLEYEIEFYVGTTEYDYTVDGTTGKVIEHSKESHGSTNQGQATDGDIGTEAAVMAALTHAGVKREDVRSLKAEREEEHGRIEYEIEFKVGNVEYEYTIDGATGNILDHETDIDD